MNNRNILISGASISGLTLAYWLQHWGFSPTILEKRPDPHERGYMIDFYGSGFDVAEKMDILEPRNHFEIKLSHFLLKAAFWPGFRSLFAKQSGARNIIK